MMGSVILLLTKFDCYLGVRIPCPRAIILTALDVSFLGLLNAFSCGPTSGCSDGEADATIV